MLHEPAVELGKDHSAGKKSRLGLIFFFIYLAVYAGFVIMGMTAPKLLGASLFFGLNTAYVYGMGLIVFAVISGLLYNFFCTRYENKMNKEEVQS